MHAAAWTKSSDKRTRMTSGFALDQGPKLSVKNRFGLALIASKKSTTSDLTLRYVDCSWPVVYLRGGPCIFTIGSRRHFEIGWVDASPT